jgi:uncharacterized protein YecT (DUF1311 family)
MRSLLLSLLLAGAPAPPTIHEPFTLLPCPPKPATTIALEGCAEHAILRGDAAIDKRVRAIFSLLPRAGRASFVRGEVSWLAYRRAICDAESSKYAGGTIAPVIFAQCEIRLNSRHVQDLVVLERELRFH